jgi:hypothetical protein
LRSATACGALEEKKRCHARAGGHREDIFRLQPKRESEAFEKTQHRVVKRPRHALRCVVSASR